MGKGRGREREGEGKGKGKGRLSQPSPVRAGYSSPVQFPPLISGRPGCAVVPQSSPVRPQPHGHSASPARAEVLAAPCPMPQPALDPAQPGCFLAFPRSPLSLLAPRWRWWWRWQEPHLHAAPRPTMSQGVQVCHWCNSLGTGNWLTQRPGSVVVLIKACLKTRLW